MHAKSLNQAERSIHEAHIKGDKNAIIEAKKSLQFFKRNVKRPTASGKAVRT